MITEAESSSWAAPIFAIVAEEEKRREGSPALIEIAVAEKSAKLRHWKRYAAEPVVDVIDDLGDDNDLQRGLEKLLGILRNEDRRPASMFRG